tara:strand:+ start:4735 stop:4938 length:204 start_codon:yes stop_codon:yes gene_type:complete
MGVQIMATDYHMLWSVIILAVYGVTLNRLKIRIPKPLKGMAVMMLALDLLDRRYTVNTGHPSLRIIL